MNSGRVHLAARPRRTARALPVRRPLLRWTPLAAVSVAVVWLAGIGFRFGWWHSGVLDLGWNGYQADTATAIGRSLAQVLAVVGTGVPAVASVLVVAALVLRTRGRLMAAAVVGVASIDQLDIAALKAVAARLRPDASFGIRTSFPSGHTAFAAMLATVVGLLLLPPGWRLLTSIWPLLMAWSRTELHAHWLTDVVDGAVLGWAGAILLLLAAVALDARAGRDRPTPLSEAWQSALAPRPRYPRGVPWGSGERRSR